MPRHPPSAHRDTSPAQARSTGTRDLPGSGRGSSSPGRRTRPTRLDAALALLIVLTVAAAFHQAPRLGFIDYDDPTLVTANPVVQQGLTAHGVRHAFTTSQLNLWVPLTTVSHMVDVSLFGNDPAGHHLVNVAFHLGASLLLYALLARCTGERIPALLVTLLFAIHPLRVESVAWVAERKDVLCAFFYMLTLWCYTGWARRRGRPASPGGRGAAWLYLGAVVAALLAMLSKPAVMTLPLAMLCLDGWPLNRLPEGARWRKPAWWRAWLRLLAEKWPFLLLALAAAAVNWWTWSGEQFMDPKNLPGLLSRIMVSILGTGLYLWRTIWPLDLAPFHPHPQSIPWLALGLSALALTLWLAAAILGLRRRRAPWIAFGLAWFVCLLLPGSGLVTITDHFAPDRYMYLAHIGLLTAVVWSAWRLVSPAPRTFETGDPTPAPVDRGRLGPAVVVIILLAATVVLAALTDRQTRRWTDSETLWTHALTVTERNYIAHQQLGVAMLQQGRLAEGVQHLQAAIKAEPRHPAPYANLSLVMARTGHPDAALHYYQAAGPRLPQRDTVRAQLLEAFDRMGAAAAPQAAALLEDKLEQNAADADSWQALARHRYAAGDAPGAVAAYTRAHELDPADGRILTNLTALLLQQGDIDRAQTLLDRGMAHPDADAAGQAWRMQGQLLLMQGHPIEALDALEQAHSRLPDSAAVRHDLAVVLLDDGVGDRTDPARAINLLEPLLAPDAPVDPRWLQTLARAQLATNDQAAARATAARGLELLGETAGSPPADDPGAGPDPADPRAALAAWFRSIAGAPEP